VLGRPVVDATFLVVSRRSLVVSRSRGVASPRAPAFAKATAGKPSTRPSTDFRAPSTEPVTQQESE
jgi:hypothetical protein